MTIEISSDEFIKCQQDLADQDFSQQLLAVLAFAKGHIQLGALVSLTSCAEIAEHMEEHWAWSELYDQSK